MVLERRDFALSMSLGDDWVMPLPVSENSFPHAASQAKCRVLEYEVTATLIADGVDLVQAQRRVIAADYNRPDITKYHRESQCVFAGDDLPLKGTYVFSVRPIECFGHKGSEIRSAAFSVQ